MIGLEYGRTMMPLDSTGFPATDAERLARVYEQLTTTGWCQGNGASAGRVCLQFAIALKWGTSFEEAGCLPVTRSMLEDTEQGGMSWPSLWEWNDWKGREHKEVLDLVERAYYRADGPKGGLDHLKHDLQDRMEALIADYFAPVKQPAAPRRRLVSACVGLFALTVTFFAKI